jgi:hypothetical protein
MNIKIDEIGRLREEDKKDMISWLKNMNGGKGMMVANGKPGEKKYESVESLIDLYSKEKLFMAIVNKYKQNKSSDEHKLELLFERELLPKSGDKVIIRQDDSYYAREYDDLNDDERENISGVVVSQCFWYKEN